MNLGYLTDPDVKAKAIGLLEGSVRDYLCGLGVGKAFLNRIHKALRMWGSRDQQPPFPQCGKSPFEDKTKVLAGNGCGPCPLPPPFPDAWISQVPHCPP